MGSKWTQISHRFPQHCLLVGFAACYAMRAARWARALLGLNGRRWDVLVRRTHVSLTRIIERQWTTEPAPAQSTSWRMIG